MYELIGLEEDRKDEVKSTFEFRPVGYGVQDMPSILAAVCREWRRLGCSGARMTPLTGPPWKRRR
ncbi:MAG: hypothetical protein ACLR23_17520 [Clostridia bacterium]